MDSSDDKIPVWLGCDPGHDDAFAILLLTHHPSFHLLGISTIHGNAPLPHTTHNALSLLTAFSSTHIPVYAGAAKPLSRESVSAPGIHGRSGLDGTDLLPAPSIAARTDTSAIDAMALALLAQPEGKAWVVVTGALTNVHLCFEKFEDRGLREHIKGLSIMGGAIGDGFTDAFMGFWEDSHGIQQVRRGNWSPWAEFNIFVDPEAAGNVFGDDILRKKTTMVPLDLTHLVIGTEEVRSMLLWGGERRDGEEPSKMRRMIVELMVFYKETYETMFGFTQGPPLHDPLAVAVLLDGMSGVEVPFWDGQGKDDGDGVRMRYEIEVVKQGEQTGRTLVRLLPVGDEGVRIPKGLDVERFWKVVDECLERAGISSTESGVFDR